MGIGRLWHDPLARIWYRGLQRLSTDLSWEGSGVDVRYFLVPETGQPDIYDHGITEAEVEWILARPGEDGPSSGWARQSIGQTSTGRYLRVI